MAYKVIILYQLYMPSYFLGTFTEYPNLGFDNEKFLFLLFIRSSKATIILFVISIAVMFGG